MEKTQIENTRAIVQKYLELLSQRDLENLTKLFAENINWDIPGNTERAVWLGKRNHKHEVKEFYQILWKNTEPISAKVDKILVEDNFAVIIGEFETKMIVTGKLVKSFFCIQITLENDLIVRYRLYEDSYAVSEAMGRT